MSTASVSFQVQNEAGVVFTISCPLGHDVGKRFAPVNTIMADLAREGLLPVKPNATIRQNLNGGQRKPAAQPQQKPGTPQREEFTEPPIGSGNGKPQANHAKGRMCPVHNVKMRRREGDNGDVWYSHRHNGEWCKGAGTKSEIAAKKVRVSG